MKKAKTVAQKIRVTAMALICFTFAARAADTGTDPEHRFAWSENTGWINAASIHHEISIHFDGNEGWLSGHALGENIGWIRMGAGTVGPYENTTSENWGVNIDLSGRLSGYAWGENVGWINFGHEYCDVVISMDNGAFSGHAWGENIGWVSFRGTSPDYGVRTLAFDTQPKGTPNWWLASHSVTENYDAGDGVPAWQKYVMDTNPKIEGDYLRIVSISNENGTTEVVFTPASTRRYYTLTRQNDLTEGGWNNVIGQVDVPGIGGEQAMTDEESAAVMFYKVQVKVTP